MTFRDIRARALIALGIGALVMGATASWQLCPYLVGPVHRPVPLPAGFPAQVVSPPGPGHAIAGWWLNQGGVTPLVLLLHSIRADRSSMLSRAKLLLGHGFSVLLIDLQGHGETPGVAITLGSRESGDVRAALGWLKRTVPSRRIGVIGCSLGGAGRPLFPPPSGFHPVVLADVDPRFGRP